MVGWSDSPGIADPATSPLRALVAGFPGAAAHVTGDQIWINRAAEEIIGYRADDFTTLDEWGRTVYRDHDPTARSTYIAARAAGFLRPEYLTIFTKDDRPRLVEFSGYLGEDEEVWVMRDVTDERRAEQDLKDRAQRLQIAMTTAGLGIWDWDGDEDVVTASASTRRLFGLADHPEPRGLQEYLDRVVPDDRGGLEDAIAATLDSASAFDVEVRVHTDHGRNRWLRIHGTVPDPSPLPSTRVIGAVRDIDSYKRLDERLIHAARMEALGQLAGGVAHDFNNLLAVIQGQVEFVKREPQLSEKSRTRLHSIERAVADGADMVSTLMRLGRPTAESADVIDVNKVLATDADKWEQVVGSDITLELRLEATSPFVRFDEARLSAVVINLASNARDAMPFGGLLSITTSNPASDDRSPSDGAAWLRLSVEDTGIGMDAPTRARVFEPFYTTKAPGIGTGLGLASVYDAVMDAGGEIEVESEPGMGTTFAISLPCAAPIARDASDEAASTIPPPHGQVAMIVEDDASILEVASDILRSAGYHVIEALGSSQALEQASAGEVPDLLLTDVVMPGLSGPQLAARIRSQIPGIPVLYMSGYTSESRGGITIDDAQLIHKPFSHSQLLERVAELLPARPAATIDGG